VLIDGVEEHSMNPRVYKAKPYLVSGLEREFRRGIYLLTLLCFTRLGAIPFTDPINQCRVGAGGCWGAKVTSLAKHVLNNIGRSAKARKSHQVNYYMDHRLEFKGKTPIAQLVIPIR
jgi:hypothetical protein